MRGPTLLLDLAVARTGRRGLVLLLLGVIWAAYGWTLLDVPRPPVPGSHVWHESIPQPWRAYMWIISGLGALVFAGAGRPRDALGYTALAAMPIIRTVSFTTSYVYYVGTGGEEGYRLGGPSALIWLAVFLLIAIIAGWDEPPRLPRPPREEPRR